MKRLFSVPRLTSILLFLLFALPALGSPFEKSARSAGKQQETTVTLVVLHTNDTHGQILAFDLPNGKTVGGVARRAALVRQIRKENPGRVLLLEAGDLLSRGGALLAADGGLGSIDIMNEIGYDAMVPGNGEFYFGVENLLNLRKHAKFPIIEANIYDRRTSSPLLAPYAYKEIDGFRIGILAVGFIHTDHPSCRGLEMRDAVAEARKYAPMLRKQCDMVIALTHIGHYEDTLLAAKVPEIDLVVGGHSHTIVPQPIEVRRPGHSSAWVAQAGDLGRYLGRIDVKLNNHSGRFRMTRAEGRLIPVEAATTADPKIEKKVSALQKPLQKVICTTDVALPNAGTDPTPMREYVLAAMRQATEADVVLLDRGAVQGGLKAGPVRLEDIYRVHPWRNSVLLANLTADQIRAALANPETISAGCEFRKNGKEIEDLRIAGAPAAPGCAYTVAIGNYLLTKVPGIANTKITDTGERIDTVLEKSLRSRKAVATVHAAKSADAGAR